MDEDTFDQIFDRGVQTGTLETRLAIVRHIFRRKGAFDNFTLKAEDLAIEILDLPIPSEEDDQ